MKDNFIIQNITEESQIKHFNNSELETFLVVDQGSIKININQNELDCTSPNICYIDKGSNFEISNKTKEINIWLIQFNNIFFSDIFFDIHKFYEKSNYISFEGTPCFNNLVSLCQMISFEYLQNQPKVDIIYNLWNSLFTIFKSEQEKNNVINPDIERNLHFQQFINLLEKHYRESNTIDFYANKLIISTRQLNKIAQELVDKNISTLITSRKIIEAKKELLFSNKNISEIGYDLGYNEKAYFTRVFKLNVGLSPTDFKKQFNYAR